MEYNTTRGPLILPEYGRNVQNMIAHAMEINDRKERNRAAQAIIEVMGQEEHGLGMCNITKCCTEVCPEHIKITDNAIIPMKERVVDVKYDPVRWLGSKIRKREEIN